MGFPGHCPLAATRGSDPGSAHLHGLNTAEHGNLQNLPDSPEAGVIRINTRRHFRYFKTQDNNPCVNVKNNLSLSHILVCFKSSVTYFNFRISFCRIFLLAILIDRWFSVNGCFLKFNNLLNINRNVGPWYLLIFLLQLRISPLHQ